MGRETNGGEMGRPREPDMADIRVIYTTWPDAETAEACAAAAVAERLAACASIGGPVLAIYRWQGAVERAGEVAMTLKTTAAAAEALCAFITARHPYETPCILALPVDIAGSSDPYLAWIEDEVTVPPVETVGEEPVSPLD
jgi:periplasmic divalent cation tolerance protein